MSRAHPLSPNHRFSHEGFEPLTHSTSYEQEHSMGSRNNGDFTIDIPLAKVSTNKSTGARKPNALSPQVTHLPNGYSGLEKESQSKFPFKNRPDSDGFRGRRQRIQEQGARNKDASDGSLNSVGKLYKKIYNFSVVTRYMFYVAPLAAAIAIPIIIGATVSQTARIGGVKIVWFFTWIEVIWISLWISKLFAKFLPYLFQFAVGVVSSGTRKYALVITALEIPLSLVFWSICALTTFVPLMTLNPDQRSQNDTALKSWEKIIKNILFACLFSTLVLLGEKLLIQLLSISYHRKQFDDKIKSSKRNINLIGLLYEASRNLFPAYCQEFAEEDFAMADVLDIGLASRDGKYRHSRSGSATPMKLIKNAARIGDKVTAAFGNVAQEITGKQVFNGTSAHSVVIQALEKKKSSIALARRLWLSFVLEGRDALYLDDIRDVLGPEREVEADEAFECLDVDGNGDISLDEMVLRIGEFGRERASIANSMHDVDQAINVLDNLLCTVVFIMVVFIFIAWLNTNFTTTLATTGTALLSLSFVFAATCQEVLGSCIFLFVKHPYDVGDRVDITDKQYVVERISLLYTVFRSVNNHKKTQVPNIVLNTNWIDNVSRSKAMREQILLYISFDTTLDDIELLRKEMQKFVRDKDNARDFQQDIDIEVTGIAEMNKMELKVEIRHKSNWSNEAVRAARRSKFMCALVLALKKVPIYAPGAGGAAAGDKANPTYSVAISHDEADKNKNMFDKEKEEKRMIPTAALHGEDDATSTAVDVSAVSDNGVRDRVQAMGQAVQIGGLTQRSMVDIEENNVIHSPMSGETGLDRQRTNDLEEVRTVLRRESMSTGRRRANQHDALSPTTSIASAGMRYPTTSSRQVPTIAEPGRNIGPVIANKGVFGTPIILPPSLPAQVAPGPSTLTNPTSPPPRVNYHEDNNAIYTQPLPMPSSVPDDLYSSAPFHVSSSQSYQQGRTRSESTTSGPGPEVSYPPRNASIVHQGGRSRAGSATSRKPIPGMGGLKGYLHGQGPPPSSSSEQR